MTVWMQTLGRRVGSSFVVSLAREKEQKKTTTVANGYLFVGGYLWVLLQLLLLFIGIVP